MRTTFGGGLGITGRCAGKGAVKLVFGPDDQNGCSPKQALCANRRIQGGAVIPGHETNLQLSDPVFTFKDREMRLGRKEALQPPLVEPVIIKRSEEWGDAAETPNVCRLHDEGVDQSDESEFSVEVQTRFGFFLCLDQRLASDEHVPDEDRTARGGGERGAPLFCESASASGANARP